MPKHGNRRTAANGSARLCPCCSGESYDECCGRFHRGQAEPATAERLMRSRFSAFAVGDTAYLLRTWHSTTRPGRLTLDPQQRWTRLEIVDSQRGGLLDSTGSVEFRAHYRERGRPGVLREHSRFVREAGRWAYLDTEPEGSEC